VNGGIYFVIGPEKQLGLYEKYLQNSVDPSTKLYRLYPRDYWIPLESGSIGMEGNPDGNGATSGQGRN
jgi:hypothetical protein